MKTHGEVRKINGKRVASLEYRSWQMMKNRCLNPRAHDYSYYGVRGITVCKRWHKFENFLADMGRKPTAQHTLERRNNDGNYTKRNCYWATRKTQARNRRGSFHTCNLKTARRIRKLYATKKYYQAALAKRFGITQSQVSQITRNTCWAE